tara:strand:- start:24277 stop:24864 length:588 start_codon:yes stop_codon:yes gene_type:complete
MADKNTKQNPNRLRFAYIVEQFETIQKKHNYIKSFHMGPDEEIDITKLGMENYPILYVEPTSSSVDNFIENFTFNVLILDLFVYKGIINTQLMPNEETIQNNVLPIQSIRNDAQKRILSQAHQIFKDVIIQFVQNFDEVNSWVNQEVDLQMPINMSPIATGDDNMLWGWTGQFTITVNNQNSICTDNTVQIIDQT